MSETQEIQRTLGEKAARQLANATKTPAQWGGITPRWLVSFLPWVPVEAGIYRHNRVISRKAIASYLISLSCSTTLLTDDALAVSGGAIR